MLFWLPVFTGVPVTCDAYQDSSLALRMTTAESEESFGTFSGLPAFTGVSDTYNSYQDSSPAAQNDSVRREG